MYFHKLFSPGPLEKAFKRPLAILFLALMAAQAQAAALPMCLSGLWPCRGAAPANCFLWNRSRRHSGGLLAIFLFALMAAQAQVACIAHVPKWALAMPRRRQTNYPCT